MSNEQTFRPETLAIHAGQKPDADLVLLIRYL